MKFIDALFLRQPWLITPDAHAAMMAAVQSPPAGIKALYRPAFGEPKDDQEDEDDPECLTVEDGIGVISIHGPMMRNPDAICEWLFGAVDIEEIIEAVNVVMQRPDVQAVFLDIDSPGGSVSGTPELAQAVADLSKSKNVYAFSGGQMCSAAYWVASQCDATLQDKIRIQYVNATSDTASGALTFYRIDSSNIAKVTALSATGQAIINAIPYPSAAQNDIVLIHSYATNTVARGVVASATTAVVSSTAAVPSLVGSGTTLVVTSSTTGSITLAANLPFNLNRGDRVYLMVPNGTIPVGATTKELNAPTVFASLQGPVLIDLTGTAACRINIVAGEYR